jgi:hypothetical protein
MWVLADVVGSFSINVGPFSANVGRDHRIFSANLVPKRRMLSGQAIYVIGPLHLVIQFPNYFGFRLQPVLHVAPGSALTSQI